jgi:hypothetical protein
MNGHSRRRFLADVGRGMLVASVGTTLAADLGLSPAWGDEALPALSFGRLEPLVVLMQETPPDKLIPIAVEKLKAGTELRTLVAAAALANARTFGGQDYVGFHSFMALAPAYQMAKELPADRAPLPVLKVLYRNTSRIQAFGGRANEVLHPVEPAELPSGQNGGELMQQATRQADVNAAERTFAALSRGPVGEAFNHLQYSIEDEVDVHRVVLAWRAWATLDLTGEEHAQSLLRQSVRYCVNAEQQIKSGQRAAPAVRTVLPKLLDQFKLLGMAPGDRRAEDAWIADMGRLIANSSREQAAEAVAAALADGLAAEDIGAAISLAANELVLRDPGRPKEGASPEKPVGSVHGDSVGVHASDAANAWRNIARVSNRRNAVASLIVGAFHTAGQYARLNKEPFPLPEHLDEIAAVDQKALLDHLEAAIRDKDQFHACALLQRYGELEHEARPVFDLLLRYGISEDGALHAEKYYRTVSEEFASARPAFRWRQLIALARVTASEYGRPAPGYSQARELLTV